VTKYPKLQERDENTSSSRNYRKESHSISYNYEEGITNSRKSYSDKFDGKGKQNEGQKKEKSLGILCKQFIGLFVNWKRVISLEEAARQISKRDIEE
jgi:hypothetical protein